MKVVLSLILLVLLCPAQTGLQDSFTSDVWAFHEHWNAFHREFFGCPKTALRVEECNLSAGVFNYKEYLSARKAAKKLFALESR
jgi:hypothetical protein